MEFILSHNYLLQLSRILFQVIGASWEAKTAYEKAILNCIYIPLYTEFRLSLYHLAILYLNFCGLRWASSK